jgi:biopolymer transport protein ExbB
LGLVYKGGIIVPFLFTAFLSTITFTIERFLTLGAASGKGNAVGFIKSIQGYLKSNELDAAMAACDKQGGSIANVVRSGLHKYKEMSSASGMTMDQRVLAIQKEVEETKALEMPMLEKNLPILSTIASVATLVALLGTVIGMIKSFSAMATAGSPDPVALSSGISEALINTALGIGTSAIAIIIYNMLTARIDGMKYKIDEAGFSMTQEFAAKHS